MNDPDYGTDISTYADGDLDPTFSPTVTGRSLVAETVARLWETPAGMFDDAPTVGAGLWNFLSAPITKIANVVSVLKNAAESDDRVDSCNVSARIVNDNLIVDGVITPSNSEPFRLVLSIDTVAQIPTLLVE